MSWDAIPGTMLPMSAASTPDPTLRPDIDWFDWHAPYGDPGSELSRRLQVVQGHIRRALSERAPGPIRVVSLCAGQGLDLIGVLADHPRRSDVSARLVELDPRNVAIAREGVAATGLSSVEVVAGDAAVTDAYAGAVPADLVLCCGVFGNVSDEDIAHTVATLPQLCAPDAVVVWTRHRAAPDATPQIRAWFADAGFEERGFDSGTPGVDGESFGVGCHVLRATPSPLRTGVRMFRFVRPGRARHLT